LSSSGQAAPDGNGLQINTLKLALVRSRLSSHLKSIPAMVFAIAQDSPSAQISSAQLF
jgi:hypothetical protein